MSKVVAEISVIPVSTADMRPCVDAAIEAIKRCGIRYEVGALGTTVEGSLDQVIEAVKVAHRAAMETGTERCVTEVRIDERQGVDHTIDREIEGYRMTMAPVGAQPVPGQEAVESGALEE